MKKIILLATVLFLAGLQDTSGQIWKDAKDILKLDKSSLSQEEAGEGIKAALLKGIEETVQEVSQVDGYFKNPSIKILFPPDAQKVESKLRSIGLGGEVDKVILSLNRAAEDAAKEAKPIFVSAIKSLTFKDAVNIVTGEDDAATQYLERTTSDPLREKFSPIIENSLEKVNATRYWEDVINTYNKIPLAKEVDPDLEAYVTQKALEGLFIMVAKEEKAIRENPEERTSEILKKVFGR